MLEVRVRAHRRAQLVHRRAHPVTDRQLLTYPTRDFSRTDRDRIEQLIEEVRTGKRAGYTMTSIFSFDIDDPKSMDRTYDRLGPRVMFAIAETNRRAEDLNLAPITGSSAIGPRNGIALWRDDKGVVYADDVRLHFDIDDSDALFLAREKNQFVILKVDGRTRSFAFLEGPNWDVKIEGEGANRTFEPRPEL